MSIEVDIDTALKTAGIQAYHQAAPQQANQPFTVYKIADSEPLNTLDGYGGLTRTDFVFDSWAATWQGAIALRDAVVTAIRASTGALANHYQLPSGENAFDEETNSYMESCSFSLWHH